MSAPTVSAPPPTSASNPMPDIYARRLSDRLQYQQGQIQTLTRAQRVAQLPYSSIEDDWVNMYDAAAQLAMRLGKQADGSWATKYVEGTPPPVPANPNVSPGEGSVRVGHNGGWAIEGTKTPENLARFDIHASTVKGFTVSDNTVYASLPPTGGVESLPLSNTDWYIKVVAVTNANVKGGATEEIKVLPLPFTTIAAYSIGAEQLKSILILASRIIVGDPTSRRFEMEPNGGFTSWNAQNVRTWYQDPQTGNVTMYGRIMGDPFSSYSNIVLGDRDLESQATLKFAYGTPVDGVYKDYIAAVARWDYYYYTDREWGPSMRIVGPAFRYVNPRGTKETTAWTRAQMQVTDRWMVIINKNTSADETAQNARHIDSATLQVTPNGFWYQGSHADLNDNWQPWVYLPKGENAREHGLGAFGWRTRGSGYEWIAGMVFAMQNDGTSMNSAGKIVGPNLAVQIRSQPNVTIMDHRGLNFVPLFASSAGPPSSMSVKNSIEYGPMTPEAMLDSLRKVVPAYYHYDNEPKEIVDLIGKHYGFIAEDFEDAGLHWLLQYTGRKEGEKALNYFAVTAWLANCVRALDEELDVLRKAARVESPRREKRIRGRRSR